MIKKITKRDGREVDFDPKKIASAINKAFAATTGAKEESVCMALAEEVQQIFELAGNETPSVEQIQDMVEKVLIDHGYVKTAKSYILYRAERSRIRDMNNRLMKTYDDITFGVMSRIKS